jgi:hypothetical protein
VTVDVNGQKRTFKNGEGVRFPANAGGKRTLTLDQVEFVGYGLNLDATHNDYEGIDAKGKAVVWLGTRGPKGTDPQEAGRLLASSRAEFAMEEMSAGATIAPPLEAFGNQRGGGGGGQQGGRGANLQPDFITTQRLDAAIPPSITSSDDFLEFLFSSSDLKYADLKAKAQQHGGSAEIHREGRDADVQSRRGFIRSSIRDTRAMSSGIVEGNDPRLRDTYVAFGAHYDHVGYLQGVLPNGQTDRINNAAGRRRFRNDVAHRHRTGLCAWSKDEALRDFRCGMRVRSLGSMDRNILRTILLSSRKHRCAVE